MHSQCHGAAPHPDLRASHYWRLCFIPQQPPLPPLSFPPLSLPPLSFPSSLSHYFSPTSYILPFLKVKFLETSCSLVSIYLSPSLPLSPSLFPSLPLSSPLSLSLPLSSPLSLSLPLSLSPLPTMTGPGWLPLWWLQEYVVE